MDLSSFITSLVTSLVIFLILMLVFVWLSRKPVNDVVYYPNRILKGLDEDPLDGGRRRRNPFAWIGQALKATEDEIVEVAGVDTAIYLLFLSSVLGILILSGAILLPVLLSVNATDNNLELDAKKTVNDSSTNVSAGTFQDLDKLSMANVQQNSSRLWAHILAIYWVSVVVYAILWKAYRHASELRASKQAAAELKPQHFAILVRDIPPPPPGQTRKEQVDSYFGKLHSDTFCRSLVVTNNKDANKIWTELEGYRKKLEHAEAVYAESKTTSKPEGTRPTCKTGFLGLVGEKVDAIQHYNEKIKDLVTKLEAEQKITIKDKQLASAIVFFKSWPAAASAAQTIHAPLVDKWTVTEAPEPCQVIWENLSIPYSLRQIRQYVVYIIVFFTIFFYLIPIGVISAFTTLANLEKYLPFLKPVIEQQAVKTVLEAYLPQLALLVFMALLPMFLLLMSKAEGIPSQSHVIRAASGKYFYFIVLNVFIGVTLGSTLFNSVTKFANNTSLIIPTLGAALPGSATFFITFVALKFFVGYGLELSRLVPLIIYHLKRRFLCKTEAEIKAAWAPGGFNYASLVPNDMLVVTVVLCYSVITPIIIPFGALYFGLGWLVMRNQALKVYVPAYESYGRMWPHIHKRILASLVLFQVTMLGFLGVKKFVYAPFVIPLIVFSFIFGFMCNKRFYQSFSCTPLEVSCQNFKESPYLDKVFEAYIPESLTLEKFEDVEQFEDARSQPPSRAGSSMSAV